jgi:hypothetical protein
VLCVIVFCDPPSNFKVGIGWVVVTHGRGKVDLHFDGDEVG